MDKMCQLLVIPTLVICTTIYLIGAMFASVSTNQWERKTTMRGIHFLLQCQTLVLKMMMLMMARLVSVRYMDCVTLLIYKSGLCFDGSRFVPMIYCCHLEEPYSFSHYVCERTHFCGRIGSFGGCAVSD